MGDCRNQTMNVDEPPPPAAPPVLLKISPYSHESADIPSDSEIKEMQSGNDFPAHCTAGHGPDRFACFQNAAVTCEESCALLYCTGDAFHVTWLGPSIPDSSSGTALTKGSRTPGERVVNL